MKAKVSQLCLTLRDSMDYIVHGILQARIPEWVAFPFSRGSSKPRNWTTVCIAGGFFTSWATREAQEYWSWVAYPFSRGSSPPRNPTRVGLQADSLPAELPGKPVKPSKSLQMIKYFKSSMLIQSQGLLSLCLKVSFHSFAKVFWCSLGGHIVLACLGCQNKITEPGGIWTTELHLSQFWRLEIQKVWGVRQFGSSVRIHLLTCTQVPSRCVLTWRREKASSLTLFL